ncbi:MAG: zinc-binding dehydrogenase [Deltaproteobacteria bacterium]|nr:zinc-binding dehydrogenase [Deltaproteobacteria bacterium]
MKALRIEKYGGPEVMQIAEVFVPEPGAGEVRAVVGKTFALDDAVDAFNHMQRRESIGKVIITP